LSEETISPELLSNASHHNLVTDGGDEKRDEGSHGTADVGARGAIDMATEEVVNRNIPFTREFEPVGAVPPVGIEVSICKA
jgi:hypothetical protein